MKKWLIISGITLVGLGAVTAQQLKASPSTTLEQEVQRKSVDRRENSERRVHPSRNTPSMKEPIKLTDQQEKAYNTIVVEKEAPENRGNRAVQEKLDQERRSVLTPDQIKVMEESAELRKTEQAILKDQVKRTPGNSDEDRSERHKMLRSRK